MFESIELLLIFLLLLALTVKPVGLLLLPIAEGRVPAPLSRADAVLMQILGIDPDQGGTWGAYARALIVFNGAGLFLLYAVLRLQGLLPMNPEGFPGLSPATVFPDKKNPTAGYVSTKSAASAAAPHESKRNNNMYNIYYHIYKTFNNTFRNRLFKTRNTSSESGKSPVFQTRTNIFPQKILIYLKRFILLQ